MGSGVGCFEEMETSKRRVGSVGRGVACGVGLVGLEDLNEKAVS